MSNDAENNSASSSSSLSTSSSSSSSESSVTSEEESHIETDSIIDKSLGIYCDWLPVKCLCNDSGFENLEVRKCQHPGGTCNKFVHHICAITWGQNNGVTDDIGFTCREHTMAYIKISKSFTPQIELYKIGFPHSDDDSNQDENTMSRAMPTKKTSNQNSKSPSPQMTLMTTHRMISTLPRPLLSQGDGNFQ